MKTSQATLRGIIVVSFITFVLILLSNIHTSFAQKNDETFTISKNTIIVNTNATYKITSSYLTKYLDIKVLDVDSNCFMIYTAPTDKFKEMLSDYRELKDVDFAKKYEELAKEAKGRDIIADMKVIDNVPITQMLGLFVNSIKYGEGYNIDLTQPNEIKVCRNLLTEKMSVGNKFSFGFATVDIEVVKPTLNLIISPAYATCLQNCEQNVEVTNTGSQIHNLTVSDITVDLQTGTILKDIQVYETQMVDESIVNSVVNQTTRAYSGNCSVPSCLAVNCYGINLTHYYCNDTIFVSHIVSTPVASYRVLDSTVINPGETKTFKIHYIKPIKNNGKWNLTMRLDGETFTIDPWYNFSWTYSKSITVQNLNATDTLYPNWTINISLDTTNAAKFRSDCNDIRIVYNDLFELDRNVTGCGTTNTQIWFQLQKSISSSSNSTSEYKVYYGNPSASSSGPSDPLKIFLNAPDNLKNNIIIAHFAEYADVRYINDSSGHSNDGVEVNSGNKQKVPGVSGEAMNFTASNNFEYKIPYKSEFHVTAFTISIWVRPLYSTYNGQEAILDTRAGSYEPGIMICPDSTAHVNANLHDLDNLGASITCLSNTTLNLGEWNHIVLVGQIGNPLTCKLYLNGDLAASATDVGYDQLWLYSNPIHIGGRYDAWPADFRGSIDDVLWFNTSLTADDVNNMTYFPINPPTFLGTEESAAAAISVSFVSPTPENNSIKLYDNYTVIAVQVLTANPDTLILNWNGTNTSYGYSNGTNTINKTNLTSGIYSFYAWANDTSGNSNQTDAYQYTLNTHPPNVPIDEVPYNNSGAIPPNIDLKVKVIDSNNDLLTVTFINASSNLVIGTVSGVASGSIAQTTWTDTFIVGRNYTWYVNVSDGLATTTSGIYQFLAVVEPNVENMHVEEKNKTSLTFMWDNPSTIQWVALYVKEEATTIRSTLVTRDNWTATGLKRNTVYNFSWQAGDIYGTIGNFYSFLVRTDGWYDGYLSFTDKRLVTVINVAQDLDNQVVNLSLNESIFEFGDVMSNGTDFRFADFYEINPLLFNVTYINVTGVSSETQTTPNATSCVGSWIDCNKTYDDDMNTFGSPDMFTTAIVYFNYTKPNGIADQIHWNVKDGDGYGWDMHLPTACTNASATQIILRAVADYNATSVDWQCYNGTDWYTMRHEGNYYHAYFTQIEWNYPGTAYLSIAVGHLDANYTNRFFMYYNNPAAILNTSSVGAVTWQNNMTVGEEENFVMPTPEITDLVVTEINSTAINITWSSSLTADSYVRYSTNQWFIGENYSNYDNYTDKPYINISGLTTNTTWYLMAVSCETGAGINCGNATANITLGTLPSVPVVSVVNYTEDRPNRQVTVCLNLSSTDSQTINLSVEYFYLGTLYETFNESSASTGIVSPTTACFTVLVDYGHTYVYRGKAAGTSSTGYSDGYQNEFMSVQYFFAGNPIEDDNDDRDRQHTGYWEGSCQQETSMWVETNITSSSALQLHWWNGTTWSWVSMINGTAMWHKEMTGLGQQWYTFEIWNATSMLLNWTKPGPIHLEAQPRVDESKFVSFGCSPSAISYDLLYFNSFTYNTSVYRWCIASGGNIYECMMTEYWGGGTESGLGPGLSGTLYDAGQMFRGGITNGEIYDTGSLDPNRGTHTLDKNKVILPSGQALDYLQVPGLQSGVPMGTEEYRYCFAFLNFYYNKTMIPTTGISNYYVRQWHSTQWYSIYFGHAQDYEFHYIGIFKWAFDLNSQTRDFSIIPETTITTPNEVLNVSGSIFNASYDESLAIYFKNFTTIDSVMDNYGDRIYEHGIQIDGMWANIMFGKYQQSFVIFNLPDNATLQGLDSDSDGLNDFQELFTYYTNPMSNDTDEGGITDSLEVTAGTNPNIWNDDDVDAPTISIISPVDNSYLSAHSVSIYGIANDSHTNYIAINDSRFGVNLGNYTNWNFTNTSIVSGVYDVNVTAFDVVNHSTSATVHFVIDYTKPQLVLHSPANATYNQTFTLNLNFSIIDVNPNTVWYEIHFTNGTTAIGNTTVISNSTFILVSGHYYITLWVNDSAANINSTTTYFSIFDYVTSKVVADGVVAVDTYDELNVTFGTIIADGFVSFTPVNNNTGIYAIYNKSGVLAYSGTINSSPIIFYAYESQAPYYLNYTGVLISEINTSGQSCISGSFVYNRFCERFAKSGETWIYGYRQFLQVYDSVVDGYQITYNMSESRFIDWQYKQRFSYALNDDSSYLELHSSDPIVLTINLARSMLSGTYYFDLSYSYGAGAVPGAGTSGAEQKVIKPSFVTDIPDGGISFQLRPGDKRVGQFIVTNIVNYDVNLTMRVETTDGQWFTFLFNQNRLSNFNSILKEKSPIDPGYSYVTYEIAIPQGFQIGTFDFTIIGADDKGYVKMYPVKVQVVPQQVMTLTGLFLSGDWPRFNKPLFGTIEGVPLVVWMVLGGIFGLAIARSRRR